MDKLQCIQRLFLDDESVAHRSPEAEHEHTVAVTDLLEHNVFSPFDEETGDVYPGPFDLYVRTRDNRVYFDIRVVDGPALTEVFFPVSPFRSLVRDYFMVCDSYFEAVRSANSSKVEAIDMGRRSIHNEGAELLRDLLEARISIDFETARRLFTLVCALHVR